MRPTTVPDWNKPMLFAKLFVSVTREDGAFWLRGMLSKAKALEAFETFRDQRPVGRAAFTVISQHDGRMTLRVANDDTFDAEVIARAAREPAFFGWLPARSELALRRPDFSAGDAENVINALYTANRTRFVHLVQQEIEG